jgi:hypothetical protein
MIHTYSLSSISLPCLYARALLSGIWLVLQEGGALWEPMMGRTGGSYRRPYRQQAILSHPPLHNAAIPSPSVPSCPFLSPLAAYPLISSHLVDSSSAVPVSSKAWSAGSSSPWQQLSVAGYIHTYIHTSQWLGALYMMPAAVMWMGGSAKSCSDGSDGDGANGRSGQVRLGQLRQG